VAVRPADQRVYAANTDGNSLTVLDGGSNTTMATLGVGVNPIGVGVNISSGCVYVTNFGANSVSVVRDGSCDFAALMPTPASIVTPPA
jgi:YVTN family beta-propeller protein